MATTSLLLPELLFLSPQATFKRRVFLSKPSSLSRNLRHGCVSVRTRTRRIRALKEEGSAVVEVDERESKLIKELNGNNGAATTTRYEERRYSNGVAAVESENGSLVKYVNGNGVAAPAAAEVVEDSAAKEDGRKRRLEEIGKEDAWFKQAGKEVEVSVTPGGRWSRFKTYSTIQRTLEIWGFVLAFIFKAWLNNQKFSYRGGMTEEKKTLRRKALAKWLKESILRLGPTFIKIGQQFSTRVDILAQEYVDQLSELQLLVHRVYF